MSHSPHVECLINTFSIKIKIKGLRYKFCKTHIYLKICACSVYISVQHLLISRLFKRAFQIISDTKRVKHLSSYCQVWHKIIFKTETLPGMRRQAKTSLVLWNTTCKTKLGFWKCMCARTYTHIHTYIIIFSTIKFSRLMTVGYRLAIFRWAGIENVKLSREFLSYFYCYSIL